MNERIKQLAEKAKKYALDAMIKITDKEQALKVYSETYDTKFAELIVQECLAICDEVQWQYGQYTFTATTVKNRVKEHFGIEE